MKPDTTTPYSIESLADTDTTDIYKAFDAAFTNYGIPTDFGLLAAMLRRRGWNKSLSACALSWPSGTIASFILNGCGTFRGLRTAYDTGTGTLPDYRNQGLSKAVLNYSLDMLRGNDVESYLLEVLQDNKPAIAVYKSTGFVTTRELLCYGADTAHVARQVSVPEGIHIGQCTSAAMNIEWFDFAPSWQNSPESLLRAGADLSWFAAYDHERTVGFGCCDPATGDIATLAVAPDYRHRGIGEAILRTLALHINCRRIKVLNIEPACTAMTALLHKTGLNLTVKQYEMVKRLSSNQ